MFPNARSTLQALLKDGTSKIKYRLEAYDSFLLGKK
jgi:hypothetical protein